MSHFLFEVFEVLLHGSVVAVPLVSSSAAGAGAADETEDEHACELSRVKVRMQPDDLCMQPDVYRVT